MDNTEIPVNFKHQNVDLPQRRRSTIVPKVRFRHLSIMLTELCNLDCWMCDFARSNGLNNNLSLSADEMVNLLRHKYFRSLVSLTLTGGEPFSYPEILPLYRMLRDNYPNLHINFSSNTTLIKRMVKLFSEVNNFKKVHLLVSIDGIDAHDQQRGSDGSFIKTTQNLEMLREMFPSLGITIKFTITPKNYHELEETHEYFASRAYDFTAKALENNPYYTNKLSYDQHKSDFTLSPFQIQSIKQQLENILRKSNNRTNKRHWELREQLMSLDNDWNRNNTCLTPSQGVFLDADMNLFTCKEYPPVLNLKNETLDVLENHINLKNILEHEYNNTAHCTKCTSQMRIIDKNAKNPWVKYFNFLRKYLKAPQSFHDFSYINKRYELNILLGLCSILRKKNLWEHLRLVSEFENKFATHMGVQYALGVSSGTSALFFALKVLGIKPGDEVITVANTWISTITTISELGAKCKFIDIDPSTGLMDVTKLQLHITPNTKAIIPVHMYGSMVDMDPLLDIAYKHDLKIIEDACQAVGAQYKNKFAGSIGDIGCFSFHSTKLVGAPGDGGMLTTNDITLHHKLNRLALPTWENILSETQHRIPSRLSPLTIPILKVKLQHLNSQIKLRKEQYLLYTNGFKNNQSVNVLKPPTSVSATYRNIIITTPHKKDVLNTLHKHRIPAEVIYQQSDTFIQYLKQNNFHLPHTDHLINNHISLPIGNFMNPRKIKKVINIVNSFS